MASRRIEDLLSLMHDRVYAWLMACKEEGLRVLITCTWRSEEEQYALWLQGRGPLEEVNAARRSVGLGAITAVENERKVTNIRSGGKHQNRRAFDFVILNNQAQAQWDMKVDVDRDSIPDYVEAGRLAKACGLRWGGDWDGDGKTRADGDLDERLVDYPHIELPESA